MKGFESSEDVGLRSNSHTPPDCVTLPTIESRATAAAARKTRIKSRTKMKMQPATRQFTKMNTQRTLAAVSAAVLTMAGIGSSAYGQDDSDPWRFSVGVPLWAPQINGDVTVLGNKRNVDISFDQLKDHLDASFSLALDAHKGKFGLFSSVGYLKFDVSSPTSSDTLKFVIANAGASYLLYKTDGERPFFLEGTLGIRYWYTDNDLALSAAVAPPEGFKHAKSRSLVDPVLGVRGSKYFTRKFHLDFSADGGGFDINNDTDWTWSVAGMASYNFTKCFSLSGGYQALAIDESNGSGANKNAADLIFHGPVVLLKFSF